MVNRFKKVTINQVYSISAGTKNIVTILINHLTHFYCACMINFVLTVILSYVLNEGTILELYVSVFISESVGAKSPDKENRMIPVN